MAHANEFPSWPLGSGPIDRQSAPPATHPDPAERVAALTQGLFGLLDQAVNEPWRWQVLLDNSATLWRYSGGNAALLMLQMAQRDKQPPTLVAGYKEWERHGRYVLKGEHALWVIAPRTSKVPAVDDGRHNGTPTPDPDVREPDAKTVVTGWRGQAVFDVSQTEGRPLLVPRPGSTELPMSDHEGLWRSFVEVAAMGGFSIEVSDSQHSLASGHTNFGSHTITIGSWLGDSERMAVLAHELGHAMLHGPNDRLGQLYGSSIEHRGLAEIEAESVAYTVLRAHGIDRGAQSASYLAGWADAVIQTEADSILQSTKDHKPLSRVEIAKSVLGRATAASKNILEVTCPAGFGGKIVASRADPAMNSSTPSIDGRRPKGQVRAML
ncbi:ArdC-like ssDNA-binding domain-containing protein [Arthrobacter sp. 35W]|uniref:ArdC-like ssDNA-binding domain-containing protein n=1 Tax=Arthrobacter sp. 35W TaxID=1132441 RepID=UPI0012DD65A5|nr:ArdC-like ssDNA-binding domain-containing protein [Arthrobacter sp. 35W]